MNNEPEKQTQSKPILSRRSIGEGGFKPDLVKMGYHKPKKSLHFQDVFDNLWLQQEIFVLSRMIVARPSWPCLHSSRRCAALGSAPARRCRAVAGRSGSSCHSSFEKRLLRHGVARPSWPCLHGLEARAAAGLKIRLLRHGVARPSWPCLHGLEARATAGLKKGY